jgi:dihydroxyacetone kinase-like predicted kinase
VGDERVVELLVAVERLIVAHRDELDALNVFPVPDADTGRNVLATVRAARAAAEQARAGGRASHAVDGALRGARGNAGVLTSQLLRALLEDGQQAWAARLARADELARAAVAHPVEGSFLTAVRAAAAAAAAAAGGTDELRAATAAAHAAVDASPTQLEVLARAGVVDSGARAAALVLEAVTAVVAGTAPDPPAVHVPDGGPDLSGCIVDDARFEVMYLLEPSEDEVVQHLRSGLDRIGGSVVVVGADRLVSIHVHTDDIGAALDVGLAHGRPHDVRVEDLHEGARLAAARVDHPADGPPRPVRTGVVVGADGDGIAQLAAATGATTLRLGAHPPTAADVHAAIARAGHEHVLLLPAAPDLATVAAGVGAGGTDVTVVAAVDGPARLLAALAVLDPAAPDADLLADVATGVTEGAVTADEGRWQVVVQGEATTVTGDALDGFVALLERLDGEPELVSLLLGEDVGIALRDAVAAAAGHRWPDADVDVAAVGLGRATFVVGIE